MSYNSAVRPRLLDLFCGAGGAGAGYDRAGFEVVGVDLRRMPNYPFEFHQADALDYLHRHWMEFDAIHASPPCQHYSLMSQCRPGLAAKYPDLVGPTREALRSLPLPWVIENVPGAPMVDPVMLCGGMFGRELYRHRLFETSFLLVQPAHPKHVVPASKAGHWRPGTFMSISGHVSPVSKAREVMGIDWCTREELSEAIPPDYAEYVGRQLIEHIRRQEAAA